MSNSFIESLQPSSSYIRPEEYDVYIADVTESDLNNDISNQMNIKYLSEAKNEEIWPLNGIFYGINRRCIVCCSVKRKNMEKAINVFFILDTGSPYTYLTANVIDKLGLSYVPKSFPCLINNKWTDVAISHSNFENVNLLGANFLDQTKVNIFYSKDEDNKYEINIKYNF
jgi:hypothetical protein